MSSSLLAMLGSALVTCLAALFIGQAALRLAGAKEWNWLAPAVGLSVVMAIGTPAPDLPGRTLTTAIVIGLLLIASMVWCLASPSHRPPARDLAAALPVALLVFVPFLGAWRVGILGVGMNNDMVAHLGFVEAYMSSPIAEVLVLPGDYPLGPHAMVAAIVDAFGFRTELAFSGWALAIPILNAWTALAVARRAPWLGKVVLATVAGMPFLVAAYYGEGAFKEVVQANLVLAIALLLSGCGPQLDRGRWVPLAILLTGVVTVYSVTGLPWPFAFLAIWLVGVGAIWIVRRGGFGGLGAALRGEAAALGIGAAVFLLTVLPQLPRVAEFISLRHASNGTGIAADDFGNLVGPLPGWEAFGVWRNPDFRFPSEPPLKSAFWIAFVVVLVVIGAVWAIRRGRWMLPLAAASAMAIWAVSSDSQSPYVSAKALVIASPLLLILAALPLVDWQRRPPRWAIGLMSVFALVLFLKVGVSDLRALKLSPVGPDDHANELRQLRSSIDDQPTLFLGQDDFIFWELTGIHVKPMVMGGGEAMAMRPGKSWQPGRALDFDSADAATLNGYRWVITARDAAGSEPPPQMRLVQATRNYELWRREGLVRQRSILNEGEMPGRVLDCESPVGRRVLAGGGVAAVRPAPVVIPLPTVGSGTTMSQAITLPRGVWHLAMPYTSTHPVSISLPGLRSELPANMDRPGTRWPIGTITVERPRMTLDVHVDGTRFQALTAGMVPGSLVATPKGASRVVPVQRACGKYVDWYLPARRAPTS